jgi:hypothetical protein
MPHLYNWTDCVSEIVRANFQDHVGVVIPAFLELSIKITELSGYIWCFYPRLLYLGATLCIPPLSVIWCVALGFRLFEGDGSYDCVSVSLVANPCGRHHTQEDIEDLNRERTISIGIIEDYHTTWPGELGDPDWSRWMLGLGDPPGILGR